MLESEVWSLECENEETPHYEGSEFDSQRTFKCRPWSLVRRGGADVLGGQGALQSCD
jgi:hypothetical protein